MTDPSSDGPELSRTLQSWRLAPRRDPGFRAAVWNRLRKRENETWGAYLRHHGGLVLGMLVVAMSVAGWGGRAAAEARDEANLERATRSYVQSLDARWMARP